MSAGRLPTNSPTKSTRVVKSGHLELGFAVTNLSYMDDIAITKSDYTL